MKYCRSFVHSRVSRPIPSGIPVVSFPEGECTNVHECKLNFYITLVDDRLRREADADTLGSLISGSKNDHTVRHCLGRATSPRAVASCTYDACRLRSATNFPTLTDSPRHCTGPRTAWLRDGALASSSPQPRRGNNPGSRMQPADPHDRGTPKTWRTLHSRQARTTEAIDLTVRAASIEAILTETNPRNP
jgi:hypothetical protein